MSQWMQCNFIQTTPQWADSVCSIRPDKHDGGDDRKRQEEAERELDERIRRFKHDREALKEAVRYAFDGPRPEPEVQAAIAPFVAADEPLRAEAHIDYAALEAATAALRVIAEWQARIAYERMLDEDDDEVLLLI